MDPAPSTQTVVLSAIKKFKDMKHTIKTNKEAGETELTDMLTDILRYFAIYGGSLVNLAMGLKAKSFAETATRWLIGALTPDPEDTAVKAEESCDCAYEQQQPDSEQRKTEASSKTETHSQRFKASLDQSFGKAAVNVNKEVKNQQNQKSEAGQLRRLNSLKNYDKEEEQVKSSLLPEEEEIDIDDQEKKTEDDPDVQKEEKKHIEFYRKQIEKHDEAPTKEEEKAEDQEDEKELEHFQFLEGEELHYSIAEMLWFLTVAHQHDLGLFPAKKIKRKLISNPIKNKLAEYGIENVDPTFGELASYTDNKTGEKLFKELYVTAFNSQLQRTEVFSALHTPNVIVSDAVRASMSIPVFFTPVTVRENGHARKVYLEKDKSEHVRYMDGGILDNYPIWIFDDLKFCLQDQLAANWNPQLRLSCQNPRTLGFRLMDKKTIDLYVNPYYDKENTKKKTNNQKDYNVSLGYMVGTLMGGYSGQEENSFINHGHVSRSAYVNNLNVSAIAFDLDETQRNLLIDEGRKSVRNYVHRAMKTQFVNEGQVYKA